MSLFGEKCVRCGERTRDTFNDRPTCGPCRQEMELLLIAANEAKRRCPIDGAELTKEIAHLLVIDRCPSCRGVWLDADEMERITGEVADEAMMAVVRGSYPGT